MFSQTWLVGLVLVGCLLLRLEQSAAQMTTSVSFLSALPSDASVVADDVKLSGDDTSNNAKIQPIEPSPSSAEPGWNHVDRGHPGPGRGSWGNWTGQRKKWYDEGETRLTTMMWPIPTCDGLPMLVSKPFDTSSKSNGNCQAWWKEDGSSCTCLSGYSTTDHMWTFQVIEKKSISTSADPLKLSGAKPLSITSLGQLNIPITLRSLVYKGKTKPLTKVDLKFKGWKSTTNQIANCQDQECQLTNM
jgi:hypothetical protein